MSINRLRIAAIPPAPNMIVTPASATVAAGAVSAGSFAASLREAFKYTVGTDTAVTPGTDKGGVHTDSGALAFGTQSFDSQRVWNGTQWTVVNNAQFRVRARVKLTGTSPGDVFQLVVLGTKTETTSVLAAGPWCPTVTDDQGSDQADAWIEETISPPVGTVVELHIKSNSASAVTMKAPVSYSASSAIPSGPYTGGSFLEVTEVPNA